MYVSSMWYCNWCLYPQEPNCGVEIVANGDGVGKDDNDSQTSVVDVRAQQSVDTWESEVGVNGLGQQPLEGHSRSRFHPRDDELFGEDNKRWWIGPKIENFHGLEHDLDC